MKEAAKETARLALRLSVMGSIDVGVRDDRVDACLNALASNLGLSRAELDEVGLAVVASLASELADA